MAPLYKIQSGLCNLRQPKRQHQNPAAKFQNDSVSGISESMTSTVGWNLTGKENFQHLQLEPDPGELKCEQTCVRTFEPRDFVEIKT